MKMKEENRCGNDTQYFSYLYGCFQQIFGCSTIWICLSPQNWLQTLGKRTANDDQRYKSQMNASIDNTKWTNVFDVSCVNYLCVVQRWSLSHTIMFWLQISKATSPKISFISLLSYVNFENASSTWFTAMYNIAACHFHFTACQKCIVFIRWNSINSGKQASSRHHWGNSPLAL